MPCPYTPVSLFYNQTSTYKLISRSYTGAFFLKNPRPLPLALHGPNRRPQATCYRRPPSFIFFPTSPKALFATSARRLASSALPSSDKRSHYEIMGVAQRASQTDIKVKYYELSKKYHPDRNRLLPADERRKVTKKFTRIKEAYEVLGKKDSRAEFDAHLLDRDGTLDRTSGGDYSTQRNARSNDHYYGHAKYSGSTHQASSMHHRRRSTSSPASSRQEHAYYANKHKAYTDTTSRSQAHRHQGTNDPLRPNQATGSNYDVPHFDFDKHYHQQRSYDQHRKLQIIKMARHRIVEDAASLSESQSSTFNTDQEFIHHHHNPYSKPKRHVITLTGPGLIVLGSGSFGIFYMIVKHLF